MNSAGERTARPWIAWLMLSIAGLALAGCGDGPPTGQVLASVDGDDVTKRDLAVEAALTRLPPGPVTLTAIVDRKLLVRRAKRERLDLTPDYLAAVRRFREATLATLAVQQAAGTLPTPTDAAVRAFVAAHDWRFAGRRLIDVEESGQRRTIDTAMVTERTDAQRLLAAVPGTAVSLAGRTIRVVASRPIAARIPIDLEAARGTLMRQQREELIRRLVAAERAATRVRYQSGFGTPTLN